MRSSLPDIVRGSTFPSSPAASLPSSSSSRWSVRRRRLWTMLILACLLCRRSLSFCSKHRFRTTTGIFFSNDHFPLTRHAPRAMPFASHAATDADTVDNMYHNVISSSKSTTVKKIQALLTKRKRRTELGQTVVEGPRMVFDLLHNPATARLVRQVLVSTDYYQDDGEGLSYSSRLTAALSAVKHRALDGGDDGVVAAPRLQLVTPKVFGACCSDTVTPQGIAAIVDLPRPASKTDTPSIQFPFYLVLDGVSDPGNVGTLLRSSLAVGVAGVVLLPHCCDVWSPKAVRSAMGASFQVPIWQVSSWEEAVELLEDNGVVTMYAATMMDDDDNDDAQYDDDDDVVVDVDDDDDKNKYGKSTMPTEQLSLPYFQVDWTREACALVIGSEGNGLSAEVRQALKAHAREGGSAGKQPLHTTHIPMHPGIESLNAGVCGSVIMFEYSRQCDSAAWEER